MDWASLEDVANGIVRDTFGEAVTYTGVAGAVTALRGVFSLEYEEVMPDSGASVVSNRPTLFLRLADLPVPPAEGDRFSVRGVTYAVEQAPHIDGTGGAVLFGKRAA